MELANAAHFFTLQALGLPVSRQIYEQIYEQQILATLIQVNRGRVGVL
jgi:hypothetical protein